MTETSKEILMKLEEKGFQAYIIGGFVRDYCIGKKSLDVDICTDATPKEISAIFTDAIIPTEKYGAVTLIYKKIRFEIITFRKEIKYEDNRRPTEIYYINNLKEDLFRRDFTINTLCMNSNGDIIDLLNGKKDLDSKLIKMIDDPDKRLQEDVLRILRAIRFATILDFKLDDSLKASIIKNGHLLKNLSYSRKKEELTRILASSNAKYGISLLCDLKLDEYLELYNLKNIIIVDDILGMWAQLKVVNIYPFSKAESDIINQINELLEVEKIDNYILYKYDFYVISIVASIKNLSKKNIIKMYENLPIKSRKEIKLDVDELCLKLNKTPDKWLKNIYDSIEKKILDGSLNNNKEQIYNYIINNIIK